MNQLMAVTLSWLIEVPLLLWLNSRLDVSRHWVYAVGVGLLATGLTHPFAWKAVLVFNDIPDLYLLPVVEACVFVFEALVYRLLLFSSWKAASLASLVCNLASTSAGLLYSWIIQTQT